MRRAGSTALTAKRSMFSNFPGTPASKHLFANVLSLVCHGIPNFRTGKRPLTVFEVSATTSVTQYNLS